MWRTRRRLASIPAGWKWAGWTGAGWTGAGPKLSGDLASKQGPNIDLVTQPFHVVEPCVDGCQSFERNAACRAPAEVLLHLIVR
jgi:hypothetical protein